MKLRDLLSRFSPQISSPQPPDSAGTVDRGTALLDRYVSGMPTAQNAVDLVPGWNHALPAEAGATAGHAHFDHDTRIYWCLEQAGGVAGRTVLELGPLEGMHTYMLTRAGAAHVDAIEANGLAYLRCLISREILNFANARFWLGDFRAWMDAQPRNYDLVVACGVLYHSSDPIGLIDAIARTASQFFIWTHYYDDCLVGDHRRGRAFSGRTQVREFHGSPITLHERSYFEAWNDPKFCGGMQDTHYWITRADILHIIDLLGFDAVTSDEEIDHPNGPAFSLFAKRRAPVQTDDGVPA